jgi:hypothetical protein
MGTRADFYIGRGPDAEWLGSVAWDGYQWEDAGSALMKSTTADEFRAAVATIQAERRDFTAPAEGWPWPWNDSNTTDYAYVLHEGRTTAYVFGREVVASNDDSDDERGPEVDWFPDMSARKNVQWGSKSGVIVVSA